MALRILHVYLSRYSRELHLPRSLSLGMNWIDLCRKNMFDESVSTLRFQLAKQKHCGTNLPCASISLRTSFIESYLPFQQSSIVTPSLPKADMLGNIPVYSDLPRRLQKGRGKLGGRSRCDSTLTQRQMSRPSEECLATEVEPETSMK